MFSCFFAANFNCKEKMKKNVFYCLFAALFAVTVVACSDDDEPNAFPIDEEIAGVYDGTLSIAVEGQPISGDGVAQSVTVTKAGDAAVSLSIKNFVFLTINVGDINLNNCPLTSAGEKSYSFTAQPLTNQTSEDGILTYNATLTKGTFADGELTLDLEIAANLSGANQNVEVTYTGTRR